MSRGGRLWRQETPTSPHPTPTSAISSPFNLSFFAHSTCARCSGSRGPLRDWLGLVGLGAQDGVSREMRRIVLFTAGPQGRGEEGMDGRLGRLGEVGYGGGREAGWGGVCYASGSTAPAVVCHTEHRDSFSLSVSLLQ